MPELREQTFAHLETLTKLMDDQFSLGGFKFGLNFIIDLIPEIGDVVTTAIALYIFIIALKFNIPKSTIIRMLF